MAKQKLTVAVEDFSAQMLARLREKQRQGFTGWDDTSFLAYNLHRRMLDKVANVLENGEGCDPKNLIDIANFAMMLHRRLVP